MSINPHNNKELRHNSQGSMACRALHALKWRYVGTTLQIGLQFMISIILARLLSPAAFGVVAIALMMVTVGRIIGDAGFGAAVIQYSALTPQHVRTACTSSIGIGVLFFALLWWLAPIVSHLFMQEQLTSILRVIGWSIIFSAVGSVPIHLLRRQLRFRHLAIMETLSYFIGYGVLGVALALFGYGVWSLVLANVIQRFCLTAMAFYTMDQSFRLRFNFREYYDLVRFASGELLDNALDVVANNLDSFVVGKWLGASALGLYNRAFDLMRLPTFHFATSLSNVIFPVYAEFQDSIPRLERAYYRTVTFAAMCIMPILFAVATVPEVVIGGLLGEKWIASAGPLRILCLSGPFWGMSYVSRALSHARGYPYSECIRQALYLVMVTYGIWLLLPFGVTGVAWAFTLATFGKYLMYAQLSLKLVEGRWRSFLIAQSPGFILSIAVSASIYGIALWGENVGLSKTLQLALIVPAAAITLIASLISLPPLWFGDLYPWIIQRVGDNLPVWLHRLLESRVALPPSS